jgi:ribosomal protein L9
MKVKLTKHNRIEKGKAGDIVEVSPARARFLLGFGLAEPVTIREQIEAPEKKTAKRTTRTKK